MANFEQYLKEQHNMTISEYQALDNDTRLGFLRGHQMFNMLELLDKVRNR